MSELPTANALARLQDALSRHCRLTIAVSGGVDSLTLARVACQMSSLDVSVCHAVSAAVTEEATQRVRQLATSFGWRLQLIDAGEFANQQYLSNPVNRCYFCKSSLYGTIASNCQTTIAAGTNTDDLSDYRPGLVAAEEHQVVHPFVEAGIDKATLRAIASSQGLGSVAQLPAQPCLASRVQTGISIDVSDLRFIARVERYALGVLGPCDIRCRVTPQGVLLQVSADLLESASCTNELNEAISLMCDSDDRRFLGIQDYQRGSAFIHSSAGTTSNG